MDPLSAAGNSPGAVGSELFDNYADVVATTTGFHILVYVVSYSNHWQNWVPLSTPFDRQLGGEVEPSSEVSFGAFAGPSDARFTGVGNCDLHETQCADEEEHRQDHRPRRLRGSLPEQRLR